MPSVDESRSYSAESIPKVAGSQPLPGYKLIEPLGRGGFGEVWKCEAPGGLHKAIKFVAGENREDGDGLQLEQELAAFQRIKSIRHPFFLTLERVELISGELVMVMELADSQLADRFKECQAEGMPGIPREELLFYFAEAAEALDVIGYQYGLQHLDVKPANLFLTAGHLKVGDYGLVSNLNSSKKGAMNRGMTPKFVAPEVLRGEVHTRSDQYSLALVYHELLTGAFPYSGRTPQQMMLQHVSSPPDLSALPVCDRSPIGTALSKKPEDRFPSCVEFVRALIVADYRPNDVAPTAPTRSTHTSSVLPHRQPQTDTTPGPGELTGRYSRPGLTTPGGTRTMTGEMTKNYAVKTLPPLTTPNQGLPALVTASSKRGQSYNSEQIQKAPYQSINEDLPLAESESVGKVRLDPIRSVVTIAQLLGTGRPQPVCSSSAFATELVNAAADGGILPQLPGDIGRLPDGRWTCKFPSSISPQVLQLKLTVLRDVWGLILDQPEPGRVLLKKLAPGGFWGSISGKKGGFEIQVQLGKASRSLCEIEITGSLFGTPEASYVQIAESAVPKLITEIRHELGNVTDRRKSPRVLTTLPITIYPLHSDGIVEPPIEGQCRDVSMSGLGISTTVAINTKYIYTDFFAVKAATGMAILSRVVRTQHPAQPGHPYLFGCQFRTDL